MPVEEVVKPLDPVSDAAKREQLLKQLDRTLAEVNAPVRSTGPNLLQIAGLVVKQIFNSSLRHTEEESSSTPPAGEPR